MGVTGPAPVRCALTVLAACHPAASGTFASTFSFRAFDGTATVRFEGDAPCHGSTCRRYTVSGPGLRGARGTISVDREHGHVQSIEIPVPDNPEWRDHKLELQRIEPMDGAAWQRWMAAAVAAL